MYIYIYIYIYIHTYMRYWSHVRGFCGGYLSPKVDKIFSHLTFDRGSKGRAWSPPPVRDAYRGTSLIRSCPPPLGPP